MVLFFSSLLLSSFFLLFPAATSAADANSTETLVQFGQKPRPKAVGGCRMDAKWCNLGAICELGKRAAAAAAAVGGHENEENALASDDDD